MPKSLLLMPVLLLLLLLLLLNGAAGGKVICEPSPLELVFAIDVSSSLTRKDFANLKNFLNEFAGSLPLGPQETQPAVISFSTNATVEFSLGEANTEAEFRRRVEAIPYYRGFTATGLAMRLARRQVFPRSRPTASKLLVVVTDGRTNHPGSRQEALQRVKSESAALAADTVRIHAVGIGGIWLEQELRDIAGGEDFSVIDDFEGLSKLAESLVREVCDVHCKDAGKVTSLAGNCYNGTQRIVHIAKRHNEKLKRCEKAITYEYKYCGESHLCQEIEMTIGDCIDGRRAVTTTWEEFNVQKQKCVMRKSVQMLDCSAIEECKDPVADIMFVLDSSHSISNSHWRQQVRFVRSIVEAMKISATAIRVGVVVYGTGAWVDIRLGQHHDQRRLLSGIDKLRRRSKQYTNTGLGLRFAGAHLQSLGRKEVQKLTVLMTDGESNRGPNAVKEASRLENLGVTIIVVGVGDELNRQELRAVATPPISEHLFFASDFNKLLDWAAKVSEETCESITPPNVTLCSLPPRRVISDCYRGTQKVTHISYEFDSRGQCTRKMVSRTLDRCMLLCSDPINGNHYYEGETWRSECHSFRCRRPATPKSPLLPQNQQCLAASGQCQAPDPAKVFRCHDEAGQLFSHCSCHAGVELNVVTADAKARP